MHKMQQLIDEMKEFSDAQAAYSRAEPVKPGMPALDLSDHAHWPAEEKVYTDLELHVVSTGHIGGDLTTQHRGEPRKTVCIPLPRLYALRDFLNEWLPPKEADDA